MVLFGFRWEKSPPHLLFLATFLRPRPPDDHPTDIPWEMILGESPGKAIERFRKHGAVRECSLSQLLAHQYTVKELKKMLRDRELPVTSRDRKNDLILRLVQDDELGMWKAVDEVDLLQCSDYGQQLAETYLKDPEAVTGARLTERQKSWLIDVLKFILAAGVGGVIENVSWTALLEILQRLVPILKDVFQMCMRLDYVQQDAEDQVIRLKNTLARVNSLASRLPDDFDDSSSLVRLLRESYSQAEKLLTIVKPLHDDAHYVIELVHDLDRTINHSLRLAHDLAYELNKAISHSSLAVNRFEDEIRHDLQVVIEDLFHELDKLDQLLPMEHTLSLRERYITDDMLYEARERARELDNRYGTAQITAQEVTHRVDMVRKLARELGCGLEKARKLVQQFFWLQELIWVLESAVDEIKLTGRVLEEARSLDQKYKQAISSNSALDDAFVQRVIGAENQL